MATKTFKIGLSNTDKTNMAQDIYERVINMCFDEYNSANTYNEGDFVVYENPADTFKLYKCNSDSVTGAWDSSKWDLATLQDILDDIEDAVQFVNDKANVDGNYPTMTVGFADALTPYDSDSGDDQDEPFSFQATGTGNGSQPDFATGSTALTKEKRGNSVVVNQLANKSLWQTGSAGNVTFTISNGILVANGTANENVNAYDLLPYINFAKGHKYLIYQVYPSNLYTFGVRGYGLARTETFIFNANQDWYNTVAIQFSNGAAFDNTKIDFNVVDLTQWFGSNDNIPSDLLSHPENFFRYYQGSLAYNAGELVNANGRYVKCIGRNQWDEETESGIFDGNGQPASYAGYIRSKNYIPVIPGATYYAKGTDSLAVFYYDKDKNFIKYETDKQNHTFDVPNNCCFIMIQSHSATYNHDITISIYYEDESGYNQYYPYEELANNDTGTETLLAYDYKEPNGTIHHNTKNLTFDGTVSTGWSYDSFYGTYLRFNYDLTGHTGKGNGKVISNLFINDNNVGSEKELISLHGSGGSLIIQIDSSKIASADVSGLMGYFANHNLKVEYELAEPTTEQGTPYSENLFIDDFGSMDFSGTNGVPQGNLIFYPVDYKAFIDTLYNYTEGTPSNIALKSDLSADKSELQGVDSQLLNAIGGTLRQCLCVKESGLDFEDTDFVDLGSLNWGKSGDRFYVTLTGAEPHAVESAGNLLCTKYKTVSANDSYIGTIGISIDTGSIIWVKDTTYNDATAFKAAMKGVLLAYEKASE